MRWFTNKAIHYGNIFKIGHVKLYRLNMLHLCCFCSCSAYSNESLLLVCPWCLCGLIHISVWTVFDHINPLRQVKDMQKIFSSLVTRSLGRVHTEVTTDWLIKSSEVMKPCSHIALSLKLPWLLTSVTLCTVILYVWGKHALAPLSV